MAHKTCINGAPEMHKESSDPSAFTFKSQSRSIFYYHLQIANSGLDIRSILHGAGDLSGPGGARECSRNHWRHTLYHLHRQTPRLQADKTKAAPRQAPVATASRLPHPAKKKKGDGLTTYSGSQQSCNLAGHGCPGKQSWNPPMQ